MDIQKNEKRHRSRGHGGAPEKEGGPEGTAEGETEDRNDELHSRF